MQFEAPQATVDLIQDGAEANSVYLDTQAQVAGGSQAASSSEAVNLVITAPKTTEELISERSNKRAEKKAEIRRKAEDHKLAGDSLFQSKNYKSSYPQYLAAIELWGSVPEYYICLAAVYRKLEWYEEAAHAATRALTMDPKSTEARYVRGVARMEQRLLKPAQTDFETVLEHEPTHLRARAALVEVKQFIASSSHLGTHDLGASPVEESTQVLDFSFPRYDYEALEIASVSDSSDCQHVGNGVPCRFYNHQGCARGTACTFSHAPDEKSVRDELGRNVCIYHLLDSCKFGASKCIYSHLKEALPKRGWWTSPEKVAKVKAVLEVAEKKAREQRHLENERWKAHIKAIKGSEKTPKSAGLGPKKAPKKKDGTKEENKDSTTEETKVPIPEVTEVKETEPKVADKVKEAAVENQKKAGAKPKGRWSHGRKKRTVATVSGDSALDGKVDSTATSEKGNEAVPQTTSEAKAATAT